MKKPSIFVIICLLAVAAILFVTRQRPADSKQVNAPPAVSTPTNVEVWDVGPVAEVDYASPNPIKYKEQIRQIKAIDAQSYQGIKINPSFRQGHFLISTNPLADGSYRLVIVDKTAGTFCLRDQTGKNVWVKSLGMKDLGSRNEITGMGTTSNMIGINLNLGKNYYYDLESGEFIWFIGAQHWQN